MHTSVNTGAKLPHEHANPMQAVNSRRDVLSTPLVVLEPAFKNFFGSPRPAGGLRVLAPFFAAPKVDATTFVLPLCFDTYRFGLDASVGASLILYGSNHNNPQTRQHIGDRSTQHKQISSQRLPCQLPSNVHLVAQPASRTSCR